MPHAAVQVANELVEDLLLALEVEVEGALRDACGLGDLHDRRLVEADVGEDLLRRLEQAASRAHATAGERAAVGAERERGLGHAGSPARSSSFSTLFIARARELVEEAHGGGHLEAREPLAGRLDDRPRPRASRRARARRTPTPTSPQRSSGTPSTAASATPSMREQRVLDLGRVHVLAARDVHLLQAAADPVVALVVALGEVAGAQPAVDDRLRGRFRVPPVAGEDVRAAHEQLALVRALEQRRDARQRASPADTACPRSRPCAPRPRAGGRARSAPPRSGRSPARSRRRARARSRAARPASARRRRPRGGGTRGRRSRTRRLRHEEVVRRDAHRRRDRLLSISSRQRSGSNVRSRTTRAPFHHASSAWTFQPPQWNCGSTWRTTSSPEIPVATSKPTFVQKQFACVRSAPFGLPVVPGRVDEQQRIVVLRRVVGAPPSARRERGGARTAAARSPRRAPRTRARRGTARLGVLELVRELGRRRRQLSGARISPSRRRRRRRDVLRRVPGQRRDAVAALRAPARRTTRRAGRSASSSSR